MDVIKLPADVQACIRQQRQAGRTVGVVPTMGALHDGHLSLVEAARTECDFVVTTIFVNPTQFGPGEDFDKYPRTMDTDLELCASAGTDLVFTPSVDDMYPPNSCSTVVVSDITRVLEGQSRPTHFDGVTTIVAKLFNITLPDRAYFGQKDYQQQLVIQRMVQDLNWPLKVVTCPIVREYDGLAMSSRNRYLSAQERNRALVLSGTLKWAQKAASSGRNAVEVQKEMAKRLQSVDGLELDYAVVADPKTLRPAESHAATAVALLAVRVGATRLIDNDMLTFAE